METSQFEPNNFSQSQSEAIDSNLSLQLMEAFPALSAYFEWVRRINGVHHSIDVTVQNEQMYNDFINLCHRNLVFFLRMTGNFELLYRLFKDISLTNELHALMEKEQGVDLSIQQPLKGAGNGVATHTITDYADSYSFSTNYDLYINYSIQVQQLTFNHHYSQITLLNQASEARLVRFERAMVILSEQPGISPHIKLTGKTLHQQLITIRNSLDAAYKEVDLNSDPDSKTMAMVALRYKTQEDYNAISTKVLSFLKECGDINQELKILYKEELKIYNATQKELAAKDKLFEKQLATLTTQLNNVRKDLKEGSEKSVGRLIEIAEIVVTSPLNPEQRAQLNSGIEKLKHLESLMSKDDSNNPSPILAQCYQEFKVLEPIIKPYLPMELVKEFDENIKIIQKLSNNELPQMMAKYEAHLSVQPSPPIGPPPYEYSEVTPGQDEAPKAVVADNTAKRDLLSQYKSAAQGVRESVSEELVDLAPGQQRPFEMEIKKLATLLDKMKIKESESPEVLASIEAALDLVKKITAVGFEKVNPKALKELCIQLDTSNASLYKFHRSLSPILESIELPFQSACKK